MRGSKRLILARLLIVLASSVPAWLVAQGALDAGPGRSPFFTEVDGPLPFTSLVRLFGDLSPAFGLAVAAAALAVLMNLWLTAGAVAIFAGADAPEPRLRVLPTVVRGGFEHLGPLLRTLLSTIVLSGVGVLTLRAVQRWVRDAGERAGWTGATLVLTLPALLVLAAALWLATVGAWSFWTRVITVADRRRRVRRTAYLALCLLLRRPFRSAGFFGALTLGSTIGSGAVLAAWLGAEPAGWALTAWTLLWLVVLVAQAFVWHWLVRAAVLLYAAPEFDDLRNSGDTLQTATTA